MARDPYEGLTPEAAINVIKQKRVDELTAEDIAFLRAREDYLSETDKAIYLDGTAPREAIAETGNAMTREERIINENRPLQEAEQLQREARDAAAVAERAAQAPWGGKTRTEAQEKLDERHEETVASLADEADAVAKEEEAAAKAAAKAAKAPAKTSSKKAAVKRTEGEGSGS